MTSNIAKREGNGLTALRRQMGRLFSDFLPEWPEALTGEADFELPLDIAETESTIVVKTEVPGIDAKDIEVSVTGEMLTIKGEKKEEKEEKGKTWHRVERSYGSFERSIRLPSAVKTDQVQAESKDGVLTVTVPKSPEAVSKKVAVKIAK